MATGKPGKRPSSTLTMSSCALTTFTNFGAGIGSGLSSSAQSAVTSRAAVAAPLESTFSIGQHEGIIGASLCRRRRRSGRAVRVVWRALVRVASMAACDCVRMPRSVAAVAGRCVGVVRRALRACDRDRLARLWSSAAVACACRRCIPGSLVGAVAAHAGRQRIVRVVPSSKRDNEIVPPAYGDVRNRVARSCPTASCAAATASPVDPARCTLNGKRIAHAPLFRPAFANDLTHGPHWVDRTDSLLGGLQLH